MAFSELELKRVEKLVGAYVERVRPAPSLRSKLDIAFRIAGQSVEIVELRPRWREPHEIGQSPVAKATFVRSRAVWKVFWIRADLKWHAYPPRPQVRTIEQFLSLVEEDQAHCFWG